jgi:hypothetical protein
MHDDGTRARRVIALIASLIAVVVLFSAGALFFYAIGAVGDVGYDSDWRVILAMSGVAALLGSVFACLAVLALSSTLRH